MHAVGTWKITMVTPMGDRDALLTIDRADPEISGTLASPSGNGPTPLFDGSRDGPELCWKAEVERPVPMTLSFRAAATENEITGHVAFGAFGSGTFSGPRA